MSDSSGGGAASSREARTGNPERVAAFTDGVFAIVITILVLEISIPVDLPGQSLGDAIDDVAPTMAAWVISFLLTGMYWVWHRDLFGQVRFVNRDAVWLNLLFLLPVCLIPFASSVLGDYHAEPIALHFYGAVLIATNLMRIVLYLYVFHRPDLLWEPPTHKTRRLGLLLAGAPIVVYLIAVAVADPWPTLSLVLYLAVPLAYFALITVLRLRPHTRGEVDQYS